MQTENLIGIAAGCLTAISLVPQILKVIKEKDASTISAFMPLCYWPETDCGAGMGLCSKPCPSP